MAGLGEFLFGSQDKLKKVSTGTPQQGAFHNSILKQLNQLMSGGGGYNQAMDYYQGLLSPGNQSYQNFASPYMQQFENEILPGIAERFAGMGALSSSGFGQTLGAAGSGLQSQLAQLFSSLQNQAAGSLTGQFNQMSQQGLGYQPFAYVNQPGSQGFMGPLAAGLGTALGGSLGGAAGSLFGSLFNRGSSPGMASNSALMGAMGMFGR